MKVFTICGITMLCCTGLFAFENEDKNFIESLWSNLFATEKSVVDNRGSHVHSWRYVETVTNKCSFSCVEEAKCGQYVSTSNSSRISLAATPSMIAAGFPASIKALPKNSIILNMRDGNCYNNNPHCGKGNGYKLVVYKISTTYQTITEQCSGCSEFKFSYSTGSYENLSAENDPIQEIACTGPKPDDGGGD